MTRFSAQQVFGIMITSVLFMYCGNTPVSQPEEIPVKFFVDPATNSEDPEVRMAYGLNITPPWKAGGSVFVNLPEHLEYMPGTKGIARHHDKRPNAWSVTADSSEANYEVESITEPGVYFSVQAKTIAKRADFKVTITNKSAKTLSSIRPLFCFQYNLLKGFPGKNTDNFAHTYVIAGGKTIKVSEAAVKTPAAVARMAQVKNCEDEHNWWAEEMGGFIDQKLDAAYTVLTSSNDDRKVILHWTPGKNLLTNAAIPCIHADPCFGTLAPGESKTVSGELIFTTLPLEQVIKEFPIIEKL